MLDKTEFLVLAINPGSTSTKVALFSNDKLSCESSIQHDTKELEQFDEIWDQYEFRKRDIHRFMTDESIDPKQLHAVVGRGGLLKPLASGVYHVDQHMISHLRMGIQGQHASNLGGALAYEIAEEAKIPAFIVDSVAVDEFEPISRISGLAESPRTSLFHALNIKATARRAADDQGQKLNDLNMIVAHLGGGITVAALKKGRIIDVNNGIGEGPFSPERSGGMQLMPILDMCFSGEFTKREMRRKIAGEGGLQSYFKTNNASEVENLVRGGDSQAQLVFEAMAYQISAEIGARATNLCGKVDLIILTGGMAHSEMLTDWIKDRCSFIGPIKRYPGEDEMKALAEGCLRVLRGEEKAKRYDENPLGD